MSNEKIPPPPLLTKKGLFSQNQGRLCFQLELKTLFLGPPFERPRRLAPCNTRALRLIEGSENHIRKDMYPRDFCLHLTMKKYPPFWKKRLHFLTLHHQAPPRQHTHAAHPVCKEYTPKSTTSEEGNGPPPIASWTPARKKAPFTLQLEKIFEKNPPPYTMNFFRKKIPPAVRKL